MHGVFAICAGSNPVELIALARLLGIPVAIENRSWSNLTLTLGRATYVYLLYARAKKCCLARVPIRQRLFPS